MSDSEIGFFWSIFTGKQSSQYNNLGMRGCRKIITNNSVYEVGLSIDSIMKCSATDKSIR